MAAGVIPASLPSLKAHDCSLSFAKSVDFAKVLCAPRPQRIKSPMIRSPLIRNSTNPGSDTAELEPASKGSPLLVPRQKYCESVHRTIRRKTRTVMVGNVALGSDHPIRIQTMTTSDTKDVAKTVEEVMRIADKGADLVRITVQGRKEADACFEIKNSLVQKNYNIPLIRVNPGNFADRRAQFEKLEYSEEDYQKELEHIEKVFSPLVEKCKKYGRAMRIGTNHGSLSDRIMSYYGDSPRGMVESAFEFARICRNLDFHNFVFSMKASNPVVMVQAYRLLVAEISWEGEDGRMKSAIGIGTLLQDGLGDTIRVSLTEPPEEEIDPCRRLANLGMQATSLQKGVAPFEEKHRHYFDFQRRSGQLPVQKEGEEVDYRGVLHRDGSVLMSVSLNKLETPELLYRSLAAKLVVGMPFKDLATVDSILLRELPPVEDVDSVRNLYFFIFYLSVTNGSQVSSQRLVDISMGILTPLSEQLTKPLPYAIVLVNLKELSTGAYKLLPEGTRLAVTIRGDEPYEELEILKTVDGITMLLHSLPYSEEKISRVHAARRLFEYLEENGLKFPVIHHIEFPEGMHRDDLVIFAGSNAGGLLVDGLGMVYCLKLLIRI
uniref:IspG TIM-barrel domain-containing protein n=1 Tax=Ananas comosus var. bracteatus TaxID=296719 RepID=A0A6V7PJ83_ANACO|nr:unnamed protein product [Ananas comosus var. bracteatus]